MIQIKALSKNYGATPALVDICLEINTGEMVVIQGPSGSGKTTLLRLIAGFDLPNRGEIYLDGELVSRHGWGIPPYRREIGMVFQRSALWPHMSVAQNLLFAMDGVSRTERQARLESLLADCDLASLAERYPDQLSGGEARRTALARALAPNPRRLLLDEPLTNLDPCLKEQLLELILKQTHSQGITLLYVTHDQQEALSIGGRLVVLEGGQVLR
jgi:ABC-type Fe3+/spermidine/putrescine transport system ATPase subunit